jgi:hypothetical protein
MGCLFIAGETLALAQESQAHQAKAAFRSHPPMRPLPAAARREPITGTPRFVDAVRGNDDGPGTEEAPWKTLGHALRRLKPGDRLCLRGGTYYERLSLSRSGTAEAPITIGSYPGELAVLDGGLREFAEDPAASWEPFAGGAEGEYVSTRTYADADDRQVPRQFLPGAWEPMWGIEEERPLALGCFADSMVPLHGYRLGVDLRSGNEYWTSGKDEMRASGIYCGPGLWFNRDSGRIHVRLAHQRLEGLGDRAYRGETDPRRLPLVVAAGFGGDGLRVSGIKHVRIHDLVLRGATGSPMIHIYGSEDIGLDHITVYGGFPGLLVNASKHIRVVHSAFRGLAAPWSARAHMKYRGTPSYQIILQDNQPVNEEVEFAWCEFTDDHDFAFLRYVKGLRFHHNLVENFNDDGLECGPKLRDHTLFIAQNRIGACLIPLSQHEVNKDESPPDHDPRTGVFVFRNVIDLRGGTYTAPPGKPDPTGAFLRAEGHLAGDHGSPTWPLIHFYHNTVLRATPVARDAYLFGLAAQAMRNTERDVFNNIFVQTDRVPGVGFIGMNQAANVREGGNLIWGMKEGPALDRNPLARFRSSALFEQSRTWYGPGWTTDDRIVDPRFVNLGVAGATPADLRLKADSPAINAGVPIPMDWPDPLRSAGQGRPDIGAVPHGTGPWSVGVDGRVSVF